MKVGAFDIHGPMNDSSHSHRTDGRYWPQAAGRVLDCWATATDPKQPLTGNTDFMLQLVAKNNKQVASQ